MENNIAWLTICAICGSNKGEFNEEFMDIICPECVEFSSLTIAGNVMRFRSSNLALEIIKEVEEITGIPHSMMKLKTRKREVVEARQVAIAAIKNRTKLSNSEAAYIVSDQGHCSSNSARKVVSDLLKTDKMYKIKYSKVLGL